MAKLAPLQDCVAVIKDQEDDIATTEAGILIYQKESKPPTFTGTVVAVGPGKRLSSGETAQIPLQKGDRVVYGGYAGTDLVFCNQKLSIMREADILAVIVEN